MHISRETAAPSTKENSTRKHLLREITSSEKMLKSPVLTAAHTLFGIDTNGYNKTRSHDLGTGFRFSLRSVCVIVQRYKPTEFSNIVRRILPTNNYRASQNLQYEIPVHVKEHHNGAVSHTNGDFQ